MLLFDLGGAIATRRHVRDGDWRDGAPHGATLPQEPLPMNTFIRWGKFNLVGAMGMAVQLGALALF
jgi:hypothetical protein